MLGDLGDLEHVLGGRPSADRQGTPRYDRDRARAVVIDDREEAWIASSRSHVLRCEQFRCWRADGTPIPTTPWPDTSLLDLLGVLHGVRDDLIHGVARTAAESLQGRRQRILEGVAVVFSGGLLVDSHQPERCPPWRLAEALGARCFVKMDVTHVTHVISSNGETGSVRKALSATGRRIHAVGLQWLSDSAARWQRQCEKPYSWEPKRGESATAAVEPGGGGGARGSGQSGEGSAAAGESRVQVARHVAAAALPAELPTPARLAAVIKLVVTSQDKPRAQELIAAFEAAQQSGPARVQQILLEITALVGGREVLSHILTMSGY